MNSDKGGQGWPQSAGSAGSAGSDSSPHARGFSKNTPGRNYPQTPSAWTGNRPRTTRTTRTSPRRQTPVVIPNVFDRTHPERATAMSLPTITGTGRLLTDPRKALTKTNNPMATALLKFQGWRKVDDKWEEGDSVVASLIAFEDTARALAAFAKGDNVTVEGSANVSIWNDKPQLNISVKTVTAAERRGAEQAVAA